MNDYLLQRLSNGFQVASVPMPNVRSVTVLALVKAGTRFEDERNNGISHFLEHMVFKGTQKYPSALKLASVVDAIGAEFNAFTDKEYTGYYVKAAGQHTNLALEVVSQLIFAPLIPEKELETEKGVILEEIRMYEDQPMIKVRFVFESLIYSNTPLGWMTVGKPENIKAICRQDFIEYRQRFYYPERMLLVLAGNDKAVQQIKTKTAIARLFAEKGEKKERMTHQKLVFSQNDPASLMSRKKTEQAHLCLGMRAFPKGDPRRYALAVLSGLLGGGMSSRLFTEIREKRGLAYYVRSSVETYTDNGYLVMQAGTEPKNINLVVKLAMAEFAKVQKGKVNQKELNKAKECLKGQFILSLEDSRAVAGLYGEDILLEGKPRTPKEIIGAIDKVEAAEVQRVAKEIFVNQKVNLAVICPQEPDKKLEKVLRF